MRYVLPVLIVMTVCAVAASLSQVAADDAAEASKALEKPVKDEEPLLLLDDEPLLLLDEEPPLLLDDPAGEPGKFEGADNSRCHVCHLAFEMEELAVVHAKEDIGCADCHGNCDAHIDDESWASGGPGTSPEIMFPAENIDPACGKCHEEHDAPATTVLQRFLKQCPEKTDFKRIVCTDCHGKHRLVPKLRKAWWDKKTGKPIRPEGQWTAK